MNKQIGPKIITSVLKKPCGSGGGPSDFSISGTAAAPKAIHAINQIIILFLIPTSHKVTKKNY